MCGHWIDGPDKNGNKQSQKAFWYIYEEHTKSLGFSGISKYTQKWEWHKG
jgi:hypothetical protein